jgi:hypothetical protein
MPTRCVPLVLLAAGLVALYICELRQDAATGHASQAFGVYHDEYRRRDGRWWYARRAYQSLTRTGRNEVFPFPQLA